jgi:nitrite transporter NirC
MMVGVCVGFGIMLIFIIGAPFKEMGQSATKALMGASFGRALTLVIFAGSELFTGNKMVMTIGGLDKKNQLDGCHKNMSGISCTLPI